MNHDRHNQSSQGSQEQRQGHGQGQGQGNKNTQRLSSEQKSSPKITKKGKDLSDIDGYDDDDNKDQGEIDVLEEDGKSPNQPKASRKLAGSQENNSATPSTKGQTPSKSQSKRNDTANQVESFALSSLASILPMKRNQPDDKSD